jgi:hypothetical protein
LACYSQSTLRDGFAIEDKEINRLLCARFLCINEKSERSPGGKFVNYMLGHIGSYSSSKGPDNCLADRRVIRVKNDRVLALAVGLGFGHGSKSIQENPDVEPHFFVTLFTRSWGQIEGY